MASRGELLRRRTYQFDEKRLAIFREHIFERPLVVLITLLLGALLAALQAGCVNLFDRTLRSIFADRDSKHR